MTRPPISAAGRTYSAMRYCSVPPGYAYVYFIYGVHYCSSPTYPASRKAAPGCSVPRAGTWLNRQAEAMAKARGFEIRGPKDLITKLTNGPGKLSERLSITRVRDNGCDLTSAVSSLWIG